jgi:hypothetical protein
VPPRNGNHVLPARHVGIRHRQNAASARTNYQRYVALAREAGLKGDDVAAENFFQHAEHFYRVMRATER